MKRILGVLISSVMLAVTCLTALPVSAKEEYTEYIVPFYSDQTKQKQVVGISNKSLLKDGVVLIPLETACEIAGATIAAENDEAVVITRNYVSWCCEYKDEKNQYLLVDSNTGEGDYYESSLNCLIDPPPIGELFEYSYADVVKFPIKFFRRTKVSCEYYDNELYVSFYEFLVMMGVDVDPINHEVINEIKGLFTSMVEKYKNDADYKAAISVIEKLFSAETGYEQFFYCTLGTPIDELYKDYYNTDLMCDLGDYYSDGRVEWANFVNAIENFDGPFKTMLAAQNRNTDYEDVLINVVTYHGDSESDNLSKNIDDSVDVIQRFMYTRDGLTSMVKIDHPDSYLEAAWKMQEKADDFEPILSNADDLDLDFSLSPDLFSMAISGLCGAMKNYAKYNEIEKVFNYEQNLLYETILSSESTFNNYASESLEAEISKSLSSLERKTMHTSFIAFDRMQSNLRNEENSYYNLFRSALKVQGIMESSSPAALAAVLGAIDNAFADYADGLILGAIDLTVFGGFPVSTLVNSGILFCADALKNTAYGKDQSRIAELDDYVFLQEVAEDCFKEHSPDSENARSSFILGLKATMLAYETTQVSKYGNKFSGAGIDIDTGEKIEHKGYVPEELYELLNQSITANVDFCYVNPGDCGDLTEMLSSNTDISKLDTTPRQDITLEYAEKTTEPTETSSESETIDFEGIYYNYIENELLPQYGLAELAVARDYSSNTTHTNLLGIVSAAIYDFCDDGTEELLVLTREKTDDVMSAYYLNLYQYTGNKVESLDRIETEEYSIHAGGEHGDSFEMIIAGNAVYQQLKTSRYGSSGPDANTTEYTIIDVNGYKFNKYQYSVNPVNVVDKSLNTVLHHDKTICAEWDFSDGCTECGLNTSITDAENAIRQKLDEIAFPYASCTLSSENGLALNLDVNESMKICDYNSYQKFETVDHTNLRDHITAPVTPAITNISGRYSNANLFVDVSGEIGSEGKIRVEYVHDASTWSTVNYHGILSEKMTFDADDWYGTNQYTIEFKNGEICISIKGIECKYEVDPWQIPNINETLLLTSKEIPNYDISSWTDEMVVNAINNYLNQSGYWNQYCVFTSDIYDSRVMMRYQGGHDANTLTDYTVTWGNEDDIAYIAMNATSHFYDKFHLTEHLNAEISGPEQTLTWQHLYADELRNFMNSNSYIEEAMFDLLDIDNNNIPELFISNEPSHPGQVQVYTIHDGKLIFLGDYGEYGYVSYNPEKNLMWSGYFNQGHGFESHYRLENGTLVEVFSCETNSAAVMDESEAYYMINGETVSKSEFETKREENTFDGWVSVGRKHPLDESTINSVLLS